MLLGLTVAYDCGVVDVGVRAVHRLSEGNTAIIIVILSGTQYL